MKSGKGRQAILITAGVIAVVIMLLPIYIMVLSSFKPLSRIFDLVLLPSPASLTLDNYRQVLVSENFPHYIGNSLFVAVTVTVVALFFHSTAGYALARLRFPGRQLIFVWILSTLMVPFAVIMIPLFILVRNLGITNSLWGIILPAIPHAYGIFLFRQFYLGIPRELEESAMMDGLSHYGIFFRIVAPLSTAIAVTLAVAFFVANWNNYLWPLIVTQKQSLWVIQIAIANFRGERMIAWNLVLAASCITIIPTVVIFLVFQRYLVEGIKMSGIKM
ncbi:MAG: carbohydrate ABC transporter permease [Spirochaetia bacterium]